MVKASGLAGGKGVIIPHNNKELIESVREMLVYKKFNDALAKIDIKLTKKGEVKEKNRFGHWEFV